MEAEVTAERFEGGGPIVLSAAHAFDLLAFFDDVEPLLDPLSMQAFTLDGLRGVILDSLER